MVDGAVYLVDTAAATSIDDPTTNCSVPFGSAIWYTYTPTRSGLLTVSTCGSDFDTSLGVSTGSCDSLAWVTCADDYGPACPTHQASLIFPVYAGWSYFIAAGGFAGATGNLSIGATMQLPSNDQCGGAIPLTANVPYTQKTDNATSTNDPIPPCAPHDWAYSYPIFGKGVWYSFTPSNAGSVSISTCGSDFDTIMQVYAGSCVALTLVVCNDDNGASCGTSRASVRFDATVGTTYLILVGGWYATQSGNVHILAVEGTLQNDLCDGALPLSLGRTFNLNTSAATSDGDSVPTCAANFGNGVWFSLTLTNSAMVTLATCGSDFDTSLQVYSGACGNLTPIQDGCNDNNGPSCSGQPASVSFFGQAGVTYKISAGGVKRTSGNLSITAFEGTPQQPPPDDLCSGAISLSDGVAIAVNTIQASSAGDPVPDCQTNSERGIWFTFTPATSGNVSLSTCGSDFDTALQVFTGPCASLIPVAKACGDNNGPLCTGNRASLIFPGIGGVTYFILAGGVAGASGNLAISAALRIPPNDTCATAIPLIPGLIYKADSSNARSEGDPIPACETNFGI